jgi:hypothetical protein
MFTPLSKMTIYFFLAAATLEADQNYEGFYVSIHQGPGP